MQNLIQQYSGLFNEEPTAPWDSIVLRSSRVESIECAGSLSTRLVWDASVKVDGLYKETRGWKFPV